MIQHACSSIGIPAHVSRGALLLREEDNLPRQVLAPECPERRSALFQGNMLTLIGPLLFSRAAAASIPLVLSSSQEHYVVSVTPVDTGPVWLSLISSWMLA